MPDSVHITANARLSAYYSKCQTQYISQQMPDSVHIKGKCQTKMERAGKEKSYSCCFFSASFPVKWTLFPVKWTLTYYGKTTKINVQAPAFLTQRVGKGWVYSHGSAVTACCALVTWYLMSSQPWWLYRGKCCTHNLMRKTWSVDHQSGELSVVSPVW